MDHDPIALLESAYRPCVDPAAWMQENAPRISAPFDEPGFGAVSFFVRGGRSEALDASFHPGPNLTVDRERVLGGLRASYAQRPPEHAGPFLLALQKPGSHGFVDDFNARLEQLKWVDPRIEDSHGMLIPLGEGTVGVVGTFSLRTVSISKESRALWERVAIHLGAACRLSSGAGGADSPDVEAVLDPGGKLLDGKGPATSPEGQRSLRAGVRSRDRARTRAGRAEPLTALEHWHALLAGRWSLVDHADSDGRRLILARRNDPDPAAPSLLTRRQRQVLFYASVGWSLKQIGYALGLAEGTVNRHLASSLRKAGLSSRAELIRVTAESALLGAPPRPPDPAGSRLTRAEQEVAGQAAAGWSNGRIAKARGVSLRTIANQLTSIYRKLGLRDRHELIRWMASRPR